MVSLGVAVCLWEKRDQKRAAALLAVLSLALYLLSIGAVSDRLMGSLEQTYEVPAHPEGDVIVMLGGGAIADVQDVDGVGMLAQSPSSRLLTTLRLHRLYNLPILLSGGQVFSDTGSEGEPARLIFFFALPLIAGNMMQQLYAFVDTLIVGRFLGVNALAAVGCTGSLMFLTLGFIIGFCTGVTIYTGQRFGAGDHAGVRQSAAACILLGMGVALTLTAIVLPLTRTLLVLMETPPEILDGAYDFISIVFAGLVIFLLLYLQNCLIRALGDSKMPTILLAVTLGINIALEPVAILVLGWGILGAAGATVFS